jgi:phosphatidylinositol glycan class A protein
MLWDTYVPAVKLNAIILNATLCIQYRCYTDHSLFGFADVASICLNKLMSFTLADVDAVIAVSHCDRENLSLRACK